MIETDTFKLIDVIPVPRGARGITITPDGRTTWIVGTYVEVSVISTSIRKIISQLLVGERPCVIAIK